MKRFILSLLIAVLAVPCFAEGIDDLTAQDRELLESAVSLVDNGMSEAAIPDFDYLVKKYPHNFLVQYERMYNLYVMHRYEDVIKTRKALFHAKGVTDQAYQMIGNAYDITGDRKQAEKVYKEGLKHFPGSGALYLELGNLYMLDNEFQTAMDYYNAGIVADPNFASNYYRGAQIYLSSEEYKVWGLVYAETEVLLAPNNEARHEEMSQMIVDCLKESIRVNENDSVKLSVNLVPNRGVSIDSKTNMAYLAFPGVYEGAMMQSVVKIFLSGTPITWSLPQLIEIRKGLVDIYYAVTDNLYGSSMYLLEYQKKVIDAGHWDAYNYFIFMQSYPDAFEEWYSSNSEKFSEFVNWYNENRFSLGGDRAVSPATIFRTYRPVDMEGWLRIQSRLLMDTGDE